MTLDAVLGRVTDLQSQLALLAPRPTGSYGALFGSTLAQASSALATTTTAAATTGTPGVTGQQVVDRAKTYLGVPYVWGGTDPQSGLDCSGLVQRVYRDLGIELPRVSRDQAQAGVPVGSMDQARPGDLLAFGHPVHHIGIYIGDGQMIEAPRPGLSVRIGPVYETPSAIRRVLPEAATFGSALPVGAAGTVGTGATAGVLPLGAYAEGPGVTGATAYQAQFEAAGRTYGLPSALLEMVARQESGLRSGAVSPAGAEGLMQLMPATANSLGVTDTFDPGQSIEGAAKLLRQLLDRFGSLDLALAGYNAGPGAVLKYDGVPPYAETQRYVQSILAGLGVSA